MSGRAWYSLQSNWLKAIAHPARLQILGVLREGEACVCHLVAALSYRQAYLSQQLAVLRRAGVLAERKDGLFVYYRVADPQLFAALDSVSVAVRRQAEESGQPVEFRPVPRASATRCGCPHCQEAK